MAAKSITIAADAAGVLAMLDAYARERGGTADRGPLQNGTRIRISGGGAALGLNVYPSKGGGCKIVFDQAETSEADEIAALVAGKPSAVKAGKSAGTAIESRRSAAPRIVIWMSSAGAGAGVGAGACARTSAGPPRAWGPR